ncbi:pimeloyl-ACP methyl ester esterase BioH [Serratia microhaemolytica]|uniref:pimeloyl-ACP methyl ester esterase BioH n=1 Tax=Serratia microhaemolytica TaxID=2675110 RepID=UPI000FDCF05D|nr:pimeloyl-ACP methyl ester esterase BioH [Serratia microhaemolytica]
MSALFWQTIGNGDRDLVMLHGWGLNAAVWDCTIPRLTAHFRLHLVDLPGYGRSQGYGALSLQQMAALLLAVAPARAYWLGWSLGGLVAAEVALMAPERVSGLISVASSPCFCTQPDWPGIRPEVLHNFEQQLSQDFSRTVERFLALQTLGTESAKQDTRQLKQAVLSHPTATIEVLNAGLMMLRTVDQRQVFAQCDLPMLRIYGYLDGLVPRKVAGLLDQYWPTSQSVVIAKAAHAPFISHPQQFSAAVNQFVEKG